MKNNIAKGVRKISKPHSDIIWIKLDRNFFNIEKDVYLATVYVSPVNSHGNVQNVDMLYEQLLSDVVKYSSLGHIVLQGDFNAYTCPDYIIDDESKHPLS